VNLFVSDLPAAGWPACGRQGEDWLRAVRLRWIEGEPASPAMRGRQRGEQEEESQPRAHTRSVGRAGRGKYSPPASPERVTAEAVSEGIKGFT